MTLNVGLFEGFGHTFEWVGDSDQEAIQLAIEVFELRVYEKFGVLERALKRERALLLDVGANLGLASIAIAQLATHPLHIIAVEPVRALCDVLRRNLAMADAVRSFDVLQVAVADASADSTTIHFCTSMPGESTRFRAEVEQMQVVARGRAETFVEQECALTTVSRLLDMADRDEPVILKVDVEGSELDVLRGIEARHWPRIVAVLMEVHDVDGRLDECVALLRREQFAAICVAPEETVRTEDIELVIDPQLCLFYLFAERH